jgi:hypothetical protein
VLCAQRVWVTGQTQLGIQRANIEIEMRFLSAVIFQMSCFFMTACHNSELKLSPVHIKKNYKEGFGESDEVKLHYLDWGGERQVLVLLRGADDTRFLF